MPGDCLSIGSWGVSPTGTFLDNTCGLAYNAFPTNRGEGRGTT
jgi:hypothetical protein